MLLGTFFSIDATNTNQMITYAGDLIGDFMPVLLIFLGIFIGIWIISRIMNLRG